MKKRRSLPSHQLPKVAIPKLSVWRFKIGRIQISEFSKQKGRACVSFVSNIPSAYGSVVVAAETWGAEKEKSLKLKQN